MIVDCSVELGLGEAATDFSYVPLVPFLESFIEFLVCELGKVYDSFAALGAEAAGGVLGECVPVLGAGGWDMEGEVGHGFTGAMVICFKVTSSGLFDGLGISYFFDGLDQVGQGDG